MDLPEIQAISTSSTPSTASSSSFYAMLPGVVRERIPTIPSLRRSITTHVSRASLSEQCLRERSQSADLTSYQVYAEEAGSSRSRSAPSERIDLNGGWKYTHQGLTLLESAVNESQYPDDNSRAFARQLYIHSLTYLLKGLPDELSDVEVASLRTSLPASLHNQEQEELIATARTFPMQPPSLLHRVLASGIIQLFVFVRFILPYVRMVIRSAYQYERTHRISEKAFASGVDAMDRVGRKSVGFIDTVLNSGNGRMGGLLLATVAWWIDGISGGINEGVGEGMAILSGQDLRLPFKRRWTD